MFKRPLLAALGLAAATSAAQADQIFPRLPHAVPTHGVTVYDSPSFGRMVEMCARFGFDCSAPGHDLFLRPDGPLPGAPRTDDETRLDRQTEQWEDFVELFAERYGVHPTPVLPRPYGLYGYSAPRVLPWPNLQFHPFGYRVPPVPRIHGFHGFSYPRHALPRGPVIPWPSL